MTQAGRLSGLAILDQYPGGRLVAQVTPLNARDEQELRHAQLAVQVQLLAAHRPDLLSGIDSPLFGFVMAKAKIPGVQQVDVDRIVRLDLKVEHAGKCRCFVVAYPKNTAPQLPNSMGY